MSDTLWMLVAVMGGLAVLGDWLESRDRQREACKRRHPSNYKR